MDSDKRKIEHYSRDPWLCGFNKQVKNLDPINFCRPLLSFPADDRVFVANNFDWRNDKHRGLLVMDPMAMETHGTHIFTCQTVTSGEGAVTATPKLVQHGKTAGIDIADIFSLREYIRKPFQDVWLGTSTLETYENNKEKTAALARDEFDKSLENAVRLRKYLSDRGNALIYLITHVGEKGDEENVVRKLGAEQKIQWSAYNSYLKQYAIDLDIREKDLDEMVKNYVAEIVKRANQNEGEPK